MPFDTATTIAIAALLVSTLGPLFTGFFALRQTNKQNEHALTLAKEGQREQRRQEQKMYYIQSLDTIIKTREMYDLHDSLDYKRISLRVKIESTARSIPDKEVQAILASESDFDEKYIQLISRLGVMIYDLLSA